MYQISLFCPSGKFQLVKYTSGSESLKLVTLVTVQIYNNSVHQKDNLEFEHKTKFFFSKKKFQHLQLPFV